MRGLLIVGSALAALTTISSSAQSQTSSKIKSEVAGLEFIGIAHLPRAPASAKTKKDCDWMLAKAASEGGKLVASLGWGVTSEVKMGAYETVSFAGQFEPSTSGTCQISRGNVAIFKGGQLLALAYAAKGSKQDIGSISALQAGLRIWDGDVVPTPIADLGVADGPLFRIAPVANEDQVCASRAVVPNIYGKPVNQARTALIDKGWAPVKNPNDLAADKDRYGRELALSRLGVIEVDSCSGTSLAFCNYSYRKGNIELSVTSMGEDDYPKVSSYEATCGKAN